MKKLLYITGILTALWSCTERVDIDLDSTWQRLVVDGYITTDTTSHFIKLSKTTDYYYNQEPPAVTGAIVEISDDLTSRSRRSLLLRGSPPAGKLLIPLERRDVRVVEGARLESVCRGNSTEGSNPSLSANLRQALASLAATVGTPRQASVTEGCPP